MLQRVQIQNSAIWTLEKLNALFYEWIDYYENTIHAGLGTTPKNQFDIGIAIGGKREMNLISYDQTSFCQRCHRLLEEKD